MLKKMLIVCAAIIGVSAMDAMAVPTVRKNGISTSSVASRTGKLPASANRMALTNSIKNFKKGTNNVTGTSGGYNKNSGKSSNTNSGTNTNTNTGTNTGSNTKPSVSGNDLVAITDRVSAIEAKTETMVNDVVVSGAQGRYVSDIALDGNKLNVTKTREVYVPVRNSSDNSISNNAEIWIVK